MLIEGKAKWAKVTGEPVWGYENKFKEWSLDVYVDEETVKCLETEGLGPKLKDKGHGKYITFKRKEYKTDSVTGEQKLNQPIRIVNDHGDLWDPKTKIGNGSLVRINFAINSFGKDQKAANILSMQVWDLVKYEGGEFPTREKSGETAGDNWEEDAA